MSRSRILGALGALLAVVVPSSPAFATTYSSVTPTQVARAAEDGVTVDLLELTPTVVGPGDTETLTVRVTNRTDAQLSGALADLSVGWAPVTSRSELVAWGDDSDRVAGTSQETEAVPDLAPGDSAEVTFELGVDGLRLGVDAVWGPRLMSVEVTDAAGTSVDTLRTFLLFDPAAGDAGDGRPPATVRLSVVAPVTGPTLDPTDPDAYAAELAARTVTGGSLSRVLDTALGAEAEPTVSLAVDPAVVSAAASSDDPGAVGWADRLTNTVTTPGTAAPDVVTLPPLDPDLGAIAHAGLDQDATAAATSTLPEPQDGWSQPEEWTTTLGWPAGTPDLKTLETARRAGVDHVLVADGLVPTTQVAATGLATVETSGGAVSAVVADAQLSEELVAGTSARAGAAVTPVESAQRLLADLAILATDAASTGTQAHVVAAMPRSWSPDVAAAREILTTLEGGGWVDVVPLAELLATPVVDVPRTELAASMRTRGELRSSTVRDLAKARRDVAALATIAEDPEVLVGDVDVALTAPLSVAFRAARPERDAAAQSALAQAAALRDGLSVVPRGELTLVSAALDLPVRIRNDHPTDATVTVVLRPDDPRLIVDEQPTVVVPAGGSLDVPVHVRAIGSGDVDVDVDVLAPSGARAADPSSFSVRVRAGWETVGTAVIAAAVGLLFMVGIWRTVRRGRSPRRTTGEYVAESATTGPTPRTTVPERKS